MQREPIRFIEQRGVPNSGISSIRPISVFWQPMDGTYFLYTDGASRRGSPGPAGIGAVLYRGDPGNNNHVDTLARSIGRATNNEAEYRAVVEGLRMAKPHGPRRLVLRSDSSLVINQLSGQSRVKAPNLREPHREAKNLMESFPEIELEDIPRECNRVADRLANLALDLFLPPPGFTVADAALGDLKIVSTLL